jgi:hypothetical protein
MSPPRFGLRPRHGMIAIAIAVVALSMGTLKLVYDFFVRDMLGKEASYYREMAGLRRDFAAKLRERINLLEQGDASDREAVVDEIFDNFRFTKLGTNEKEIRSWQVAPRSPERTAAVLKWAKIVEEEEEVLSILDARFARQIEQGDITSQISGQEEEAIRREVRAKHRP